MITGQTVKPGPIITTRRVIQNAIFTDIFESVTYGSWFYCSQ